MHIYPSLMRIATIRNKSFGRHHFHDKLPLSELLINLRMIDFQTWIRTFHFCAFIEGTNEFIPWSNRRKIPTCPQIWANQKVQERGSTAHKQQNICEKFPFPLGPFLSSKNSSISFFARVLSSFDLELQLNRNNFRKAAKPEDWQKLHFNFEDIRAQIIELKGQWINKCSVSSCPPLHWTQAEFPMIFLAARILLVFKPFCGPNHKTSRMLFDISYEPNKVIPLRVQISSIPMPLVIHF